MTVLFFSYSQASLENRRELHTGCMRSLVMSGLAKCCNYFR